MKVYINYAVCNSCGLCREVCPEGAITAKYVDARHLYEVHPEKCTGAADCLAYCPAPGALVEYDESDPNFVVPTSVYVDPLEARVQV